MVQDRQLLNFVNGQWQASHAAKYLDVTNPASAEVIAQVPLSPGDEVDEAARFAEAAAQEWRRTPVGDRTQHLFKLKRILDENMDEIARTITTECGKTYAESVGEMRRAVENVEVACGMPILMQGYNNEDIARGIDEHMIRQPLGVVAIISPFNFPGMIPFWFMPYALAAGNCVIVKPSEKVPLTTTLVFELMEAAGFPDGVVQLVNGGKETVDAILDHPTIRAVSMVGSTPVAKYIYSRATSNGKRAQCQAGAKNPVVIMPDADIETAARIMADSAFGCAGQRCLAASVVVTVGEAHKPFSEQFADLAMSRKVGFGLDEGIQMGPVITAESKARIEGLIASGADSGAKILVDGRNKSVSGYDDGYWVYPTVLDEVNPGSEVARTEIFGPVLSMMNASTLDDAIKLVNDRAYGNMACIFTSSGAAARQFRYDVLAGNIGVNIGVAAPMAYFPFSGWKESFFGDMHGQSWHAMEFFTQTKVVIERWPKEWSRQF